MSEITYFVPLRIIRYKDKSLILHGLTPQGNQAFFLTSYIKGNKNLYPYLFYPLAFLEIEYFKRPHAELPIIKKIQLIRYSSYALNNPLFHPLFTFLSEIYYTFITHDDGSMYRFIEDELLPLFEAETPPKEWIFVHLIKMLDHLGYGLQKWFNWNILEDTNVSFVETSHGKINTHILKKIKALTIDKQQHAIKSASEAFNILQFLIELLYKHTNVTHSLQSMKLIELYISITFDQPTP